MLLAFLALATAGASAEAPARPVVEEQARATVRILQAAELRIDRLAATDESVLRNSIVRESDDQLRAATLIEFY